MKTTAPVHLSIPTEVWEEFKRVVDTKREKRSNVITKLMELYIENNSENSSEKNLHI